MYSQIPAALAELLANAYDADATEVSIKLYDKGDKKIIVEDNGIGMSFDDINSKFLLIGRNRRENQDIKTAKGRQPSGKKGLGKLSLFGIGQEISIHTKENGSKANAFSMNWEDIKNTRGGDYEPRVIDAKIEQNQGTKIVISKLKRTSKFSQSDIVDSLSKLFTCFDVDFQVNISVDDANPTTIDQNSKFEALDIQFEWRSEESEINSDNIVDFNSLLDGEKQKYVKDKNIKGKIITTEKPLKPGLRGIALFARKRLINLPDFFGNSGSSHFYAYVTGMLEVDFVDEYSGEDDLISTNRQALNWDHPETQQLKIFLQHLLTKIQADWRKQRKEKNQKEVNYSQDFNYENWLLTLPEDKADSIQTLLNKKTEEDGVTITTKNVLIALQGNSETIGIAPEYAEFHWRYLHKKITDNKKIYEDYKNQRYMNACDEAVKIFTEECRKISQNTARFEHSLMELLFEVKDGGGEKESPPFIQLINKDNELIFKSIQNGYCTLSQGMYGIFRNIVSHNTAERASEYITDNDCLDVLSLVSHLLGRLDRRVSPKK